MASSRRTYDTDVITLRTVFAKNVVNSNIPALRVLTADGLGGTYWAIPSSLGLNPSFNQIITSAGTYTADLSYNRFRLFAGEGIGMVNGPAGSNQTSLFGKAFTTLDVSGNNSFSAFANNILNPAIRVATTGAIQARSDPATNTLFIDGPVSNPYIVSTGQYGFYQVKVTPQASTITSSIQGWSGDFITANSPSTTLNMIGYNDIKLSTNVTTNSIFFSISTFTSKGYLDISAAAFGTLSTVSSLYVPNNVFYSTVANLSSGNGVSYSTLLSTINALAMSTGYEFYTLTGLINARATIIQLNSEISNVNCNIMSTVGGLGQIYLSSSTGGGGGGGFTDLQLKSTLNTGIFSTIGFGYLAASTNQTLGGIAIGNAAGQDQQDFYGIAIGELAGNSNQGASAVAIGLTTAYANQGNDSVAVGTYAGYSNQGGASVAIGLNAAYTAQNTNAVAIGIAAGSNTQGDSSVAIGNAAGSNNQSQLSVAIGPLAGAITQNSNSVAIGYLAGYNSQNSNAIAIGLRAGSNLQATDSIAIGRTAGNNSQQTKAVAVGTGAGSNGQGAQAIAIGFLSAWTTQGSDAVALGSYAGYEQQKSNAVAIGLYSGQSNQGVNSIAIGMNAGKENQAASSIVISALGDRLDAATEGFFVAPMRTIFDSYNYTLGYNSTTKEVGMIYNSIIPRFSASVPFSNVATGTSGSFSQMITETTYTWSFGAGKTSGNNYRVNVSWAATGITQDVACFFVLSNSTQNVRYNGSVYTSNSGIYYTCRTINISGTNYNSGSFIDVLENVTVQDGDTIVPQLYMGTPSSGDTVGLSSKFLFTLEAIVSNF